MNRCLSHLIRLSKRQNFVFKPSANSVFNANIYNSTLNFRSLTTGISSAVNYTLSGMRSMSNSKIDNLINDPARNLNHEATMRRKHDGPLLIIDVREPAELAETGTVPDSINIPLMSVEDALGPMTPEAFRQTYGAEKPSKGALIVFSCRSGKRSRSALSKALALGYLNAAHYEGGWLEWEKHLKRH